MFNIHKPSKAGIYEVKHSLVISVTFEKKRETATKNPVCY